MEHEIAVDKLSQYRDGAMIDPEREALSRHVADCAECAATLADWERLARAFFRRGPAPSAFQTEAFAARVMARLPETEAFAWLRARWLVPALGLSFAALAFSLRSYPVESAPDPLAEILSSGSPGAGGADAAAETPAADALGFSAEDR